MSDLATQIKIDLNDGHQIPALALGCIWDGEKDGWDELVYQAIIAGYRHFDTAEHYGSEKWVGKGIRRAIEDKIVTRGELFVTSKVWPTFHDKIEKSFNKSMSDLGLDYIDMYLQHWPLPMKGDENGQPSCPRDSEGNPLYDESSNFVKFYKDVVDFAQSTGKIKSVGVSNFNIQHLEKIIEETGVTPVVNQIEIHPCSPQLQLVKYCKEHNIVIEAYAPLGAPPAPLTDLPLVKQLADKYVCAPTNILTSYHIVRGNVAIARTSNLERAKINMKFVRLTDHDLAGLDHLGVSHPKRFWQEDWGVPLGFDNYKKTFSKA